jgi:hypothetical protein
VPSYLHKLLTTLLLKNIYSEEMLTTSMKMRNLAALVPPTLFPSMAAIISKGISIRQYAQPMAATDKTYLKARTKTC